VLCSICGRSASCEISQAAGRPWCKACQKRRARCAGCGQVELIRGGTVAEPLCAACTRPDPASDQARYRRDAGHFVRWAQRKKLTSLEFPATRWHGPARTIDTEARWAQARWLLHDHAVHPVDRVAALLVLLYAQTPAAVSRLTLEHVQATERAVCLRLGREPIALPEPLAGLVTDLVARRSGHAALGDQATSPWLFPGGRPGQPISACQLADRMRRLGLRPAQSRTTALSGLATELPAAVLARLLGIHIKVAVAWQQACAGDWARYAADYSRRTPAPARYAEPAPPHADG
jgi:hypothetical protein